MDQTHSAVVFAWFCPAQAGLCAEQGSGCDKEWLSGSQLSPGSWAGQGCAVTMCPLLMTAREQSPAAARTWGLTPGIIPAGNPTVPGEMWQFQ